MKNFLIKISAVFTDNIMLKIVSLVFAIVIWIAVVNVNDPMKTDTIRYIPVAVVNDNLITENNQTYNINGRMYVDVTVNGRRSVVTGLKTTDFVATVSMDEISVANTVPVKVEVAKSLEKYVTVVGQSVSNLSVEIENIETKSFEIEAQTSGDVSEGFRIKDVKLGRKNVKVTATTAKLNKIDRVVAEVDLTDVSEDYSDKYRIKLYDKEGNRIKTGESAGVELSANQVKVTVELDKLKTIPVNFDLEGTPESGYDITQAVVNPSEVTIAGARDVVNGIDAIVLDGDIVNIDGITENRETEFSLYDYITSEVEIVGGGKATLSIFLEGDVYKEFTIKESDIEIINVPDDYKVSLVADQVSIPLYGKQQYIDSVDISALNPVIDFSKVDLSENSVSGVLEVTLPENVNIQRDIYVKLKCKKVEEETESKKESKKD